MCFASSVLHYVSVGTYTRKCYATEPLALSLHAPWSESLMSVPVLQLPNLNLRIPGLIDVSSSHDVHITDIECEINYMLT